MSKNKFNKEIKTTLYNIMTNHFSQFGWSLDNTLDRSVSERLIGWYFSSINKLDSRFYEDTTNAHAIRQSLIVYKDYCLQVFIKNYNDPTKFPLVHILIENGKSRQKKKIYDFSPSYIKDMDDLKHHFRYCLDKLHDIYLEDIKKEKLAEISHRKYIIEADTFEAKVKEFLSNIKDCADDEFQIKDPVWRADIYESLMNDNNEEQIYQTVKFSKNGLDFYLEFTLNPRTFAFEISSNNCGINGRTPKPLTPEEDDKLVVLSKQIKELPDTFREWQNFLLKHFDE